MNYLNQKVVIRCNRAGVFFGVLKSYDAATREATLTNCRQLWYWSGAASLMELSQNGVKRPQNCKFTIVVPEVSVMEVIEVLPCSDKAVKSIKEVTEWKA